MVGASGHGDLQVLGHRVLASATQLSSQVLQQQNGSVLQTSAMQVSKSPPQAGDRWSGAPAVQGSCSVQVGALHFEVEQVPRMQAVPPQQSLSCLQYEVEQVAAHSPPVQWPEQHSPSSVQAWPLSVHGMAHFRNAGSQSPLQH